jgi:hypothetical protein
MLKSINYFKFLIFQFFQKINFYNYGYKKIKIFFQLLKNILNSGISF